MELYDIFKSEHYQMTEVDPEKDSPIESGWTLNPAYARLRRKNPTRPMAPMEIKKDWEGKLKAMDESRNRFYYALRKRNTDEDLIGFVWVTNIEWTNGQGFLRFFFPDEESTSLYLSECLQMALGYVFDELNLYHIIMEIPSYAAKDVFIIEGAGFQLEARLREMIYFNQERHDRLMYGLMAEEWRQAQGRIA
jgi:RimJ/RimL family protein N-acetyltransferase